MNIIRFDSYLKPYKLTSSVAIIGDFDGVHKGHQSLLAKLKEEVANKVVITFNTNHKDEEKLLSEDDKIKMIEEYGVNDLVILNFDAFKCVFYSEFIKFLKEMNVKKIICGKDIRFGFKAEGDIIDLENNFDCLIVPFETYHDEKISSSMIKNCDDIDVINYLLGRNYKIEGKVVMGSKIGRELGFKTANIDYTNYHLPKDGVYSVEVLYDGATYKGLLSLGHNPSINYQEKKRMEVHILDFNQDIYGKNISVFFKKYLGKMEKYDKKEELIKAIKNFCQLI